ncbi:MAG: AAA family ATPase, partial [Planctomycetales bacterium]|nr:AAA family ATPase [Planctomycetales bacterium]
MQWTVMQEGRFQACGETQRRLPPGGYSCSSDNCGKPLFQVRQLESDQLLQVPGSLADEVIEEINRFWTIGERYEQLGFLHRRGYLLYGKQGGGKSSVIQQVVSNTVAAGNVAFYCGHPYHFVNCLTQFRRVEPDRPLVCVFEDIDAIIKDFGDSLLLQWLDGNHQIGNAVNLASTNYPEKLEPRIVSRPRRFDRIVRIDAPCARLREAYLSVKLPEQNGAERQHWVDRTDGFTFAALSEL